MLVVQGIRSQMESLLGGGAENGALKSMQLGLSHSLSRFLLIHMYFHVQTYKPAWNPPSELIVYEYP